MPRLIAKLVKYGMIGRYLVGFLVGVGACLFSIGIRAQEHDHDEEHHQHHKNEIGVANSPVYFVKEKELSYGLHIHYVRTINESKFGIGLGYERIFDEHEHTTLGVVVSYRPTEKLGINVAPGATFEGNADAPVNFALHIEGSYEFEIGNFHVGPVLEFAYDPEDYHISLGLHLGYGF